MSMDRRTTNPGKRERVARNRQRRCQLWIWDANGGRTYKLGREHSRRWAMRSLTVADSRKPREERRYEPARSTPPVPSNNAVHLTPAAGGSCVTEDDLPQAQVTADR